MKRIPLFVLCLWVIQVFSQEGNNLAVDATIKSGSDRLVGATVLLLEDGREVKKVITGKNGRFDLILDYNHEYIIEMKKNGYVQKKLYFNTHNVPEDEQAWGYEYGGIQIELYKKLPGVDYSALDEPVGKFTYEPNYGNFIEDFAYNKFMKKQLQELEDDYKNQLRNQEALEKKREQEYELAMRDAKLALDNGDFLTAQDNYSAANKMKPDEPLPLQQLALVEQELNAKASADEEYKRHIGNGDKNFASQAYEEAKLAYGEALKIKNGDKYATDQLTKIDAELKKLEAEQNAEGQKRKKYEELIASGDQALKASSLESAKAKYVEASNLYPEETYPKTQLQEIERLTAAALEAKAAEAALAKKREAYDKAINAGDMALRNENYVLARDSYNAAAELFPDEPYPGDQLKLVEEALSNLAAKKQEEAEQKELNAKYSSLMAQAGELMKTKKYESAIQTFEEALVIKPEEPFPAAEIKRANTLISKRDKDLEEQAKQAELAEKLNALIARGTDLMKQEKWAEAKPVFIEARDLNSRDPRAETQLKIIEQRLGEAEKERLQQEKLVKLESEYREIIANADAAFDGGELNQARNLYNDALQLKPSDTYPKAQLSKIEQALAKQSDAAAEAAELAELNSKFDNAMTSGNTALAAGNFQVALDSYNEAAALKPSAPEPKEQLKQVRDAIAQMEVEERKAASIAQRENQYKELLLAADRSFRMKNYDDAAVSYKEASSLKPDVNYPKDQLAEIEKLRALEAADNAMAKQQLERKQQYDTMIEKSDNAFDSKDYRTAESGYLAALEIIPEETYPKAQLTKIRQLQAIEKEEDRQSKDREDKYNAAIASADQFFNKGELDKAGSAYRAASGIFPDRSYPKDRLLTIDELKRRNTEEERKNDYDALIAEADKFFLNKDLLNARTKYQAAIKVYPDQAYPKDRLARIEKMIDELAEDFAPEERLLEKRIIEETYEEGKTTVTIRKVILGDKEDIYKRVIHPWGGKYYFLNQRPISELVWQRETTKK